MAVLAMAHPRISSPPRMPRAMVVTDATEMSTALASRRIPVLAPYAWLRRADPLPHSWEVTSDSIAAWIARAIAASRLVLVKPPDAEPQTDSWMAISSASAEILELKLFPRMPSRCCTSRCGPDVHGFFVVPRDSAALLLAQEAALA